MQFELDQKYKSWVTNVTTAIGSGNLPEAFTLFERFFENFDDSESLEKIKDSLSIFQARHRLICDEYYKHNKVDFERFEKTIDNIRMGVQNLKNELKPLIERQRPKHKKRPEKPQIKIDIENGWQISTTFKWSENPHFAINNFGKFLDYWESLSPSISFPAYDFDLYGQEMEIEITEKICWRTGIIIVDEITIYEKDEDRIIEKGPFMVEALVTLDEAQGSIKVSLKGESGTQILLERIKNWWVEIKRQNGNTTMQNKNSDSTKSNPDKVSIFLASSSELEDDRREFEIFINRENKRLNGERIFLSLELWEDFIDAMSKTRLQSEYNRAVKECDIFVSLFFTKVGKYTEEEFETAFNQFQKTGKPRIYTYFKNTDNKSGFLMEDDALSLLNFKRKLIDLGHYQTEYRDIDSLKYQFKMQLEKILPIL